MARRPIGNPLLLPELFQNILDHLDPPNPVIPGTERSVTGIRVHEPSKASRRALFALAQTCHTLAGPSLDRLWRALDSFAPFVYSFSQALHESAAMGMDIVLRYAVRVRELRVMNTPENIVSVNYLRNTALQSFWNFVASGPLGVFPYLKVLVWDLPVDPHVAPFVEALFTSKLVSIDITLEGGADTTYMLLLCIVFCCPNIKALRWNFDRYPYDRTFPAFPTVDVLSRSVLNLQKIENLEFFEPFGSTILKDVLLSSNFKTLGIMLDHTLSQVEEIDIAPTDTPFLNVEAIELELWNFDFLTSLLRPEGQRFRDITLIFHSLGFRPLVEPMLSCFTALATPQRIDSLQSITLSLHRDCHWEHGPDTSVLRNSPVRYCLTFETLSPLAAFRCLRRLFIALHNQISIDDHELATLARNWPLLEVLRLICRSGGWPWESAKYPTLRGLLALIEACPLLWAICLPIDARDVPMDASPDIRNTAMECIEFPDALIDDPRPVAEFLQKHLPAVRVVSGVSEWGYASSVWGGDAVRVGECQRLWDEVETLLQ